ncbi:MAG: tetratricopeptide repeat protein [Sphingobium sp.]|nr:tetratricopeptide repeat protein [Sphingobium sp.]MBP6111328.1 tetratricopeptide repeat protein [Sphingobium sp.]MBP8671310.1 tetratricopeptide repeat protein [Sphingobium sp.]MBP9156646.1 tetratricopeptide repeat protein [Sphingobium sp.]
MRRIFPAPASRWTLALAAGLLLANSAQARDTTEERVIGSRFGLPASQARALLDRLDRNTAALARAASRNHIRLGTLRAIAIVLGAEDPQLSDEDMLALVERKAADAAKTQAKIIKLGKAIDALDPGGLRERALDALDRARTFFDEGRLVEADSAFGELTFLRASDRDNARRAWFEAVVAQAQIAVLNGQNELASVHYYEASNVALELAAGARGNAWELQMANGRQWLDRAELFSDRAAAERALAIYRDEALPLAPRETARKYWGLAQQSIGLAHLQIAMLDTDLASGAFNSALAAFQLADLELKREPDASDWANLQSNLGNLNLRLAERNHQPVTMRAAASRFAAALEVVRREDDAAFWAALNDNLGNAYLLQGQFQRDANLAAKAITAYEKALEVRTRENSPREWALTQINYGAALPLLGSFTKDPALFVKAEEGLRGALDIFTRDGTPQWWAMAQANLGAAYLMLATITHAPEASKSAVTAFTAVLEARGDGGPAFDVAQLHANLANALLMSGRERESVVHFVAAQSVFTREAMPKDWAQLQYKLGIALAADGDKTNSETQYEVAIEALKGALEIIGVDTPSGIQAMLNLAVTEANLGDMIGKRSLLKDAIDHAKAACDAARRTGDTGLAATTDKALAYVQAVRDGQRP